MWEQRETQVSPELFFFKFIYLFYFTNKSQQNATVTEEFYM